MKKTCFEFLLGVILAVCAFRAPAWADTVVVVCKSDFQLALVGLSDREGAGKTSDWPRPARGGGFT